MSFPKGRRPSASMVVAMLALFIALGGSVYAAGGKFSGTQVKKNSLPGNRIKRHTITGTQVNLGKLGTVENSKKLGGQDPAAFASASKIATSGLVRALQGQSVPVLSFGPFTLTLQCEDKGAGKVLASLIATSSEAGSHLDSSTPKTTEVLDSEESTVALMATGVAQSLIAPSGASLQGVSDVGVNTLNAACVAEFSGLTS